MKGYYTKTSWMTKWCTTIVIGLGLFSKIEATAYQGYELETVASGYNQPDGMTYVNSSGDIYFTERAGNIRMIPADGGAITTIASGLNQPSAICADNLGNLYFTEFGGGGTIKKILASDHSLSTLESGIGTSQGICIDAFGNIFYGRSSSGNISKRSPTGVTTTFSSGLNIPQEMCIDTLGNIYVAEWSSGTIRKIPSTGGTGTIIASGLSNPYGLSIDASENIYFTEFSANTIKKILASDGSIITMADGLSSPTGLCVDALNTIYFGDWGSDSIRKLFISATLNPTLTVDFTNGAEMAAPVIGKVEFSGNSSSDVCTFSGSATDDVQVTQGKVAINSGAPVASGKSMRMNGGNLIVTADFELPIIAMDQAGTLEVNTNGTIGLQALTGSGALTIATANSGTGNVHLKDLSANTGGIAACSQPVLIDSATQFPGNTCAIEGVVTVDAAPAQASTYNLTFGEIAATSANTAANSLTSATLYATKIDIGAKDWAHDVTAH